MARASIAIAIVAGASLASCGFTPTACGANFACPTGETCVNWDNKNQCLKGCATDPDGGATPACPDAYYCKPCLASGACPTCTVCVAACVPV